MSKHAERAYIGYCNHWIKVKNTKHLAYRPGIHRPHVGTHTVVYLGFNLWRP